jgi:dTDP-4-amino-4,6-dideoxygalactose transaminase
MPSFTFIAVTQAAQWNRYRPWFIDIDPHTWQTSPDAAREILEDHRDHIAGIVLPNALGVGSPHIDEWERLSQEWDLPIVIDSAAGFGSKYADSTPLGSRGSCEIFSFHSTKPFGIGEGGALVSLSRPLIETTHDFQNFGFNESKICYTLGLNGKMSEIAASIGRRQLEDFDSRLNDRGETFKIYREALSDAGMSFQPNAENSSHFCASICAETHEQKLNIRESLTAHRVQSRDYYNPPLHLHDYFRLNPTQAKVGTLKATEQVCSRIISLPIHDQMDPENRDRVISAVLKGLDS